METTRGDLVKEYEKTAYSLSKDDIGGPIKTKYGYHLIKLLNKKGEKIKSQHILLSLRPSEKDSLNAISFLDSIKTRTANDPGLLDSIAVSMNINNSLSGNYENIEIDNFPASVKNFLKQEKDYSFSPLLYDSGSFYFLYKYSYLKSEERTPENNYIFLENLALNRKLGVFFENWVQEKIEKTYVKINNSF